MNYREAMEAVSLPLNEIPLQWDARKVTIFPEQEHAHWVPSYAQGFLTSFFEQYDHDAHWSPYWSLEERRLKKRPCSSSSCTIHDAGESDAEADAEFGFLVWEIDPCQHGTAVYDSERAHRLALTALDLMPKSVGMPNLLAATTKGGWRGIIVPSHTIRGLHEYEGWVRGVAQEMADALNPALRDQMGIGFVDLKTIDGFRLWREQWVVRDIKGTKVKTWDRPVYLLRKDLPDVDSLPWEEEPEEPEPTEYESELARVRAKIAAQSSSSDPETRARKYIHKIASIQGEGGDEACFEVATALVKGFAIPMDRAVDLMWTWNVDCAEPRWSEEEIARKLIDASRLDLPLGYLLERRS